MLSQRSSANCIRSETLNLSNSSRGRFVMAQGYRPITVASTTDAALEVCEEPERMVFMHIRFGGARMIDMLVGDPLPRIC
jgi:hypothetical protein